MESAWVDEDVGANPARLKPAHRSRTGVTGLAPRDDRAVTHSAVGCCRRCSPDSAALLLPLAGRARLLLLILLCTLLLFFLDAPQIE